MKIALTPRLQRSTAYATAIGLLMALLIQAVPFRVLAANTLLVNRSDRISNPVAGAISNHEFGMTIANTTQPVGSISLEFCSNTPVPNTTCTPSAGFDASAAVLATQTGETGFSIDPSSTPTHIILTRIPSNPTGVASVYTFTGITNPSNAGSHYVRLQTYSSTDGTGVDIENGGVVYAISPALSINSEVPPYLRFCAAVTIVNFDCSTATSFFIDFGELSSTTTKKASSQFVVATNALSGYSITLSGTTLISGNNIIPAMAVPTASTTGSSQFGINLKANANPAIGSEVVGPGTSSASAGYNVPDQYKFVNGDTLVSVGNSNSNRKFTVSYITNIDPSQAAGVYATTVTYIALANF